MDAARLTLKTQQMKGLPVGTEQDEFVYASADHRQTARRDRLQDTAEKAAHIHPISTPTSAHPLPYPLHIHNTRNDIDNTRTYPNTERHGDLVISTSTNLKQPETNSPGRVCFPG